MKNINFKKTKCCVKDIPVGECFIFLNDLFMVVPWTEDADKNPIICVNLSNGEFPDISYVDLDTMVYPANVNIDVD